MFLLFLILFSQVPVSIGTPVLCATWLKLLEHWRQVFFFSPLRTPGSHLVRKTGQQIEHKISHPLDKLLQGLQRGHVQDKFFCLQVNHHLVNV